MPVAYSSLPSRIIFAIASRSGAGGRSSTSFGTRLRTVVCARISGGELANGARKSIAWHAHRIKTAKTWIASSKARYAIKAACMLMLT